MGLVNSELGDRGVVSGLVRDQDHWILSRLWLHIRRGGWPILRRRIVRAACGPRVVDWCGLDVLTQVNSSSLRGGIGFVERVLFLVCIRGHVRSAAFSLLVSRRGALVFIGLVLGVGVVRLSLSEGLRSKAILSIELSADPFDAAVPAVLRPSLKYRGSDGLSLPTLVGIM